MIELAGYGLTQVSLTGHRFTADSDIFDAIDLASAPTMLSFDSRATRKRIEALSWVEKASIERVFPGSPRGAHHRAHAIRRMAPRRRATIWSTRPAGCWPRCRPNTAPALPRLAGDGAAAAAAELFALLAGHPDLMRADRCRRARRRAGDGRCGCSAAAPSSCRRTELGEALARAAALAATARETGSKEIDLRVAGRTLVRERRGGGQPTGHAADAEVAAGGI